MNRTITLLESFCTPPIPAETDFDRKVLADAAVEEIDFEGNTLHCYSWGAGPTVLMVHGWGSKASHLALLARHLVRAGFRAVVMDGPSHGISLKSGQQQSSIFEFGRALATVTSKLGTLYALIGHSLGALAALFASAGYRMLARNQVYPQKLVLISSPISIRYVVDVYCKRERLNVEQKLELTAELEHRFDFSISDYSAIQAVGDIRPSLLIVHDEEDLEVPFSDAIILHEATHGSQIIATRGGGHKMILVSRAMMRAVEGFLRGKSDGA